MTTQVYYVKGMHCASCELFIEKQLLEEKSIKVVDASLGRNEVRIEYDGPKPDLNKLNRIFAEHGYELSEQPFADEAGSPWALAIIITAILVAIFLQLDKFGLASVVNIGSNSSLPAFFVFGLIAGVSSCAALIGGLILSLSKQWTEKYTPHFLFNFGRIISYGLFGALLGLVGQSLRISAGVTSILITIVSIIMLILALQMLGVKAVRSFQLALPKSITHRIAGGNNRNNRAMPFVVGFLTFFLPCGFTLIAQGVAILSGSPLRGGLIMATFALGTFIPLLIIGLSSSKLLGNKKWSGVFLKTAGLLILFFVLYNLNLQFNLVQRLKGQTLNSNSQGSTLIDPNLGPAQVIKTTYTTRDDIVPNNFLVKVGQPVRMEVDVRDNGYGCMSTIMIPGLYNKPLYLQKGQTLVMEFVPTKVGDYQITCAMGVPRGVLKVTN